MRGRLAPLRRAPNPVGLLCEGPRPSTCAPAGAIAPNDGDQPAGLSHSNTSPIARNAAKIRHQIAPVTNTSFSNTQPTKRPAPQKTHPAVTHRLQRTRSEANGHPPISHEPGAKRTGTSAQTAVPALRHPDTRPASSGLGEALGSTGAERTPVREHRSGPKTKPKPEIAGRALSVRRGSSSIFVVGVG